MLDKLGDAPQDDSAYSDTSDDIRPTRPDSAYRNMPPRYPEDAVRHGQHGVVDIIVHVRPDGRPGQVEITSSSGVTSLDHAAVEALSRWHFQPQMRGAVPVPSQFRIAVHYDGERTMTIRIDTVVTRGGDGGQTSLGDGSRVDKDALRVEAYGTVDEANAVIGGCCACIAAATPRSTRCWAAFRTTYSTLARTLCVPDSARRRLRVGDDAVQRLEAEIAALNASLPPLNSFVLPGGTEASAHAHLARVVIRRAERRVVSLAREEPVTPSLLRFLNRLSDHLFVLGRQLNEGHDVLWVPGGEAAVG